MVTKTKSNVATLRASTSGTSETVEAKVLETMASDREATAGYIKDAIKISTDAEPVIHKAGVWAVYCLIAYGDSELISALYDGLSRAHRIEFSNFLRNINRAEGMKPTVTINTDEMKVTVRKDDEAKASKREWLKGGRDKAIERFEAVEWSTQQDENNAAKPFVLDDWLVNAIKTVCRKEANPEKAISVANALKRLADDKGKVKDVDVKKLVADAMTKRKDAVNENVEAENTANTAAVA